MKPEEVKFEIYEKYMGQWGSTEDRHLYTLEEAKESLNRRREACPDHTYAMVKVVTHRYFVQDDFVRPNKVIHVPDKHPVKSRFDTGSISD
jgi:hypothetical protein